MLEIAGILAGVLFLGLCMEVKRTSSIEVKLVLNREFDIDKDDDSIKEEVIRELVDKLGVNRKSIKIGKIVYSDIDKRK